MNWVSLCRRTNDPKLSDIEHRLDAIGIGHRRNGDSFHAPILEVPEEDHDRAYSEILLAPTMDKYILYDDVPDDDSRFLVII